MDHNLINLNFPFDFVVIKLWLVLMCSHFVSGISLLYAWFLVFVNRISICKNQNSIHILIPKEKTHLNSDYMGSFSIWYRLSTRKTELLNSHCLALVCVIRSCCAALSKPTLFYFLGYCCWLLFFYFLFFSPLYAIFISFLLNVFCQKFFSYQA